MVNRRRASWARDLSRWILPRVLCARAKERDDMGSTAIRRSEARGYPAHAVPPVPGARVLAGWTRRLDQGEAMSENATISASGVTISPSGSM
jgi:hypothetical protein